MRDKAQVEFQLQRDVEGLPKQVVFRVHLQSDRGERRARVCSTHPGVLRCVGFQEEGTASDATAAVRDYLSSGVSQELQDMYHSVQAAHARRGLSSWFEQIRRASTSGLHQLALSAALTIPDVLGSIDKAGNGNGPRSKAW